MATLASMVVRLGIDTDQLRAGAARAKALLAGVGKAAAGLGAGVPAAAAGAVALGGLAAGAAAAGLAYKAFSLAAGPQMAAVTEAATLAEEAQKAAAAGAEDAAEKQKAYQDALAQMPKHTRAMAREFIGLKSDHQKWSDSMSSSTMPVYTKGIKILRSLLPTLTPFVKSASSAISGFLDNVAQGVKGARFKDWADDMAAASGGALSNFLNVIKNLAVGFAGLLQAFLPASEGTTGGLVKMTAAFANWGSGLKQSEGFDQFLALAAQGGKTLGTFAIAAGQLLVALAPLIGVTTQLALILARIINGVPTPVLTVLAGVIATVTVASKLWAAKTALVATANRLMASSTYTAVAGWTRMMAAGSMAYVRIAAGAVASAATTAAAWVGSALVSIGTWIAAVVRAAATAVLQFTLMAARAVAWAAIMAAQWLIAMGPVGWIIATVIALALLIYANWDKIKAWTKAAWDWVWQKVQGAVRSVLAGVAWLAAIPGRVSAWFGQMKDRAILQLARMVIWVQGLPGRIISALSALGSRLATAARGHFERFKTAAADKAASFVAWVRGIPGRIVSAIGNLKNLLVSKGADVVRGLVSGVKSMGGWLKGQLMSFAKNMVPGPIAKALGINSPSKVMARSIGRWIPAGIADGALTGKKALTRVMARLVTVPKLPTLSPLAARIAPAPAGMSGMGTAGAGGAGSVFIEHWHAAENGSPEANARALAWRAKARG